MAYQPPTLYQQQQQQQQPYPYAQQPQQGYQQSPYANMQPGYQHSPYPQQHQQQPYPQQHQQQPYPQQHQQPYQPHQPHPLYQAPTTYAPAPPPAQHKRGKALLVGCCYPGTSAALSGCINDVQCIKYCLENRFGFTTPGCIVVLTDDQHQPDFIPTRANILRGIQWLMQDQRPGDSLFFHFSGHGSQQADYSGDELDGQDETILPTDHKTAGQIVDDELNALLVRPLQHGVTLHALVDACHSGTAMDLAYRIKADPAGRMSWKLKSRVIKGTSGGTAFQLGACKDSQTAADTNALSGGSAYTGAATFSFIDAIERYGVHQSYANLLLHMMESLKKQGGTQPTALSGVAGTIGSLAGMAGGKLTGMAAGMLASFVLGPAAMGGQIPVLCCDKQVDVHSQRLCI